MNIDPELELEYIKIDKKHFFNLTLGQQEIISKRNENINKQFEFNESDIAKLELLNTKLLLEEKRIFPFYKSLLKENNNLVAKGLIDDFNIHLIVTFYRTKYYEDLFPESEHDFIVETPCDFMMRQDKDHYVEDDWRETHMIKLSHFKHCYTFHHLYDHTELLLFDVCQIDDVWLDLKVDYQFHFKIP
tara:strand:- start:1916 stop:2479 length:564 start_codon:yes stop_codon:yes gene_type:complete